MRWPCPGTLLAPLLTKGHRKHEALTNEQVITYDYPEYAAPPGGACDAFSSKDNQQEKYLSVHGDGSPPPAYGAANTGVYDGQREHSGGLPPRGADPKLWTLFQTSFDANRPGAIAATELQRALTNGDWTPLQLDTVKILMTVFDTDHRGAIEFSQFAALWKYVKDWQAVFVYFDHDRSGTIDCAATRDALAWYGYNLSDATVGLLWDKYADPSSDPTAPGAISFDQFIRASVAVKQLSEAFRQLDTDRDGWIRLGYEGFLETVVGLA